MAQDPWAQFRVNPAQAPQQAPREDIVLGRDPYKQAAEGRAQQDQALQVKKFNLDQQKFAADQKQAELKAQGDPGPGYKMQPDGTAVPIPGGKADTNAEQGRNALGLLKAAGVNIQTGDDPVADLIKGSTSGGLEKYAANAYGFVTGDATSGMENIGKLQTIASDLTLQMTGGSLGAQVSNSDRDFIVQRIGNIADASVPADQRLAAWEQVKKRMATMAGIELPSKTAEQPVAYYKDGGAYDKNGNFLGLTNMDDGPAGGGNDPNGGGGGGSNIPISQDMRDRALRAEQMATGDQSGLQGLSTLAQQGITLGLADEAAGVGGFLSSLIQGEDPRAGYVTARDARRASVDRAKQSWGLAGTAAEFLGGGGAARLASAPNSLLQAARQGAGVGAVAGYGSGEGGAGSTANALAGAAIGGGLGAGFQGIGNALARRSAATAPDMAVVEAGQRQGIPIRQPDARPDMRGQLAQAESTQSGGPIIRAAREADTNAVEARIAEVGGQGNPSDPYALGSRVQGAGQRYIAKTKEQATRLYDRARQLAGNTTVTPRNADAALDANIQELRAAGENSNAAAIKYLEGLRSDIDRGLSLESVQNLRTNMRGQISQQGLTGTDTERRVAQVLDAMNLDLSEQLPKEAGQALKAADGFYKQRQEFINGTLKQFLGNRGNPLPAETAAQRLVSMAQGKGNFERFSSMWKQLDQAEQADVSATIAASLGRKANGEFSLSTLIRSLDPAKGINPRTAQLVFGKDGAQALQDLRVIASAKTDAMGRQSPSGIAINSAAGGLKTLLWGALGMAGGGPGGAAAGAVGRNLFAAWGEQRAAKMLLNPDFTKWLRNMPEARNPQAIDRYMGRLATIRGISANDNQAFTNAVMQAFRSSPGTVAASGQQENETRRVPPQQ